MHCIIVIAITIVYLDDLNEGNLSNALTDFVFCIILVIIASIVNFT